jgi:hypothetical protein
MPMKLPKPTKMRGQQVNILNILKAKYTKGFWSHSKSFCALKNCFLLGPVMFFFGDHKGQIRSSTVFRKIVYAVSFGIYC